MGKNDEDGAAAITTKSHRESANDARIAAGSSELANVRDRQLRSAEAYDALADREEYIAAKAKVRVAEAAARLAVKSDQDSA